MTTEINRRVKVGAVFEGTIVTPKWFVWENRRRMIAQVTWRWYTMDGETRIVHFSVTDGGNLFELTFNPVTLEWRLVRVADE